jgi:hypothetical protein
MAIKSFEKALELNPDFTEVKDEDLPYANSLLVKKNTQFPGTTRCYSISIFISIQYQTHISKG